SEEKSDAHVHRPETRARRYPRHGGGQSGVHVSRRVQPGYRRSRGSQSALSSRESGRRRGEDEAGPCVERSSGTDSGPPGHGAGAAGSVEGTAVRRLSARTCVRSADHGARPRRDADFISIEHAFTRTTLPPSPKATVARRSFSEGGRTRRSRV